MDGAERVILMGFLREPATAEELEELERDVRLAGILLRDGHVSPEDLEAAARMRRQSGLLLEHCLVRMGAVDFDTMLEAMTRRRDSDSDARTAKVGGGNAEAKTALHTGR